MSIIFDALKKAQAKLTSAHGKLEKNEEEKPKPETTVFGFGINEDLTQPIKPLEGTKQAEDKTPIKDALGQKATAKSLKRSWVIHDIKNMNPVAFILLIILGIAGAVLVFYIFNVKMRDKYLVQIVNLTKPKATQANATKGKPDLKTPAPQLPPQKNMFVLSPELSLSLDGIVSSEGKNLALINDQIVEVGDIIKGAQVLSITPNVVVVSFQGKEITMTFK